MLKLAVRIAPVLVAAFCAAALAPSASAGSAVSATRLTVAPRAVARVVPAIVGPLAGYVLSGSSPFYDFDTNGGAITVATLSTGDYQVTLGGLGGITGGMVQVTPFNAKGTCAAGGWFPSGSALVVNVFCYSLTGHPANTGFALIVTQPVTAPPGTFDYSWVYRAASSGKLTGQYQYNSAHKGNSLRHLGTGRYQVTFSGAAPAGTKGTVKVSAYGSAAGDCAASGWHGSSKGLVVDVNCYAASGKPVNRDFDVTYAARTNLMGLGIYPTANALVSAAGRVLTQFDSQHKAHVTVTHAKRGLYLMQLNGIPENFSGGDVQVSPVTGNKDHCVAVKWKGYAHKTVATVDCFDGHGLAVNSAFAIQFVEAYVIA
jgi:hypothetical protein